MTVTPLTLMDYVSALENRGNRERGQQVLVVLDGLGIKPVVQECRRPRIRNIIVDFSPGAGKQVLFSAHYDAVRGSPGANDNASGVAVLLGLCHELRQTTAPVRVIFFDREEAWLRTPCLRLGLLGSFYYVWKNDPGNIVAVFNLEYCGSGELLAMWPIKSRESGRDAVRKVEQAALQLAIPFKSAHVPWTLLSSDHLAFRLRGVASALTLSLIPARQVPLLDSFVSNLSLPRLLLGRRPALPEPLSLVHTRQDTSSRLSEKSLRLMLSLLLELVRKYSSRHLLLSSEYVTLNVQRICHPLSKCTLNLPRQGWSGAGLA